MPRNDEFRIGVDTCPGPQVSNTLGPAKFGLQVPFLRVTERPNLVTLYALAPEPAHLLIHVEIAGVSNVGQEAQDGLLINADDSARSTNRVALNQGGKDAHAEFEVQAVHNPIIRERTSTVNVEIYRLLFS